MNLNMHTTIELSPLDISNYQPKSTRNVKASPFAKRMSNNEIEVRNREIRNKVLTNYKIPIVDHDQ